MYDAGTAARGAMAGLIVTARLQAGLGVRELARRAGVSHSQIVAIEQGKVEPTLPTVQRILRGAGMEVRLTLAPYDDHDEVLSSSYEAMSKSERAETDDRDAWNLAAFRAAKRIS